MAERENTGAKIQSGNGGLSVRSGLSGNELKVIAIIAMAADHLAWTLWPGYANKEWWLIALHLFGRLAAPTMWFMIAEGYTHTSNLKKYLQRLFVFAVLSHFAYNFCFGISFVPFRHSFLNQTSVIWAKPRSFLCSVCWPFRRTGPAFRYCARCIFTTTGAI